MDIIPFLNDKEVDRIVYRALRERYRESMERQRVPSDYLLMFTEGGESHAVATAISIAQHKKTMAWIKEYHGFAPPKDK